MKQLWILCLIVSPSLMAQSLVVPGDFPDPSVIRHGDTYWSTATTSNWAPAFPLLSSKDLVHWTLRGSAFQKLPSWADYYFWAPEISHDNGKFFIYYSAHKRDGNLCVAVASSDRPEGPYVDHGPLVCQEAGSIDAFPMRDENGKLYLIWKEDGNSVNLPTPIWAMEMNEARTELTGEKIELFRNEAPWEANLVEGVSIIKQGEYFYAFYAAAGCCGRACTYGVGMARSKKLMGPWEKDPKNPLLKSSDEWKCPGHGTPVEMGGKFYLMYHAYNTALGDVYTGRQGVLSEFRFSPDGWIEFLPAPKSQVKPPRYVEDAFLDDTLSLHWQWSVFHPVRTTIENGALTLQASPENSGAFIGQKTFNVNYQASATVVPTYTTAEAGLALVGDENNLICVSLKDSLLRVWKLQDGKETVITEKMILTRQFVELRVKVSGADDVVFSYKTDGKSYTLNSPVDGFFLPPWDRAVRVALLARGDSTQHATFDNFTLRTK